MPVLSGSFNWQSGLIWRVGFIAANGKLPAQLRDDDIHFCDALVDTGASATCISSTVASNLKLEPSGKTDLLTARGKVEVNVYDIRPAILLPMTTIGKDSKKIKKDAIQIFSPVRSPEINLSGTSYSALIGWDILKQGVFVVSPDGHYSFAY